MPDPSPFSDADDGKTSSPPRSPEERRARKAERREKQRVANLGRSRRMHEARRLGEPVGNLPPADIPSRNVGCSGWFYWHWRNAFYPDGLATKDWFAHYKSSFRTVELNAPFYAWPTVNAVKAWLKQAGTADFVYTVKVCELITHVKRFKGTKTLVRDFGFIADLLGPRMGCFLFQLPPAYDYTPARLKSIAGQLDPARRNVVEFRHKSWWNEKVYDAFRQTGTIFCSISAPRLPDSLITTAEEVYIRFHGKDKWYNHDYSTHDLQNWRRRVAESGCRRVWAYFNNDRNACAISNAREFRAMLEA